MNGKYSPPQKINPEEAIELFQYAKTEEMFRCMELYQSYKTARANRFDALIDIADKWELMSLLSFIYDTARIQGIREAREHRKERATV